MQLINKGAMEVLEDLELKLDYGDDHLVDETHIDALRFAIRELKKCNVSNGWHNYRTGEKIYLHSVEYDKLSDLDYMSKVTYIHHNEKGSQVLTKVKYKFVEYLQKNGFYEIDY